jgi:hypothetical protein
MPQLQLQRVIDTRGLEDCSDLVALATPAQLAQVLDLDLWRPAQPGRDEQFDPERVGVWLEVLVEAGADKAAELLAAMPIEPLVAGLAHHVRVFDLISVATHETTDGGWYCHRPTDHEFTSDIGGYQLVAKRTDAWDAIVEVLTTMATSHHECFTQIIRGVVACSDAGREFDGLDRLLETEDQLIADMSADRYLRREQQGYATPAEARAFLDMARQGRAGDAADPVARAYFRAIEQEFERDPTPGAQLAFLANTLIAGCSIQSRPFTPQEASDAAKAVCNLGQHKTRALLGGHLPDLVGLFQLGWKALHDDVAMFAASQLIDTLTRFRITDREIQSELNFLRIELTKQWRAGEPWRARHRLEAIAMLDLPAWATLVALIAECPVRHAAMQARESRAHRIEMSKFEWIADGSDLAAVRKFMQELPEMLGVSPLDSRRRFI